MRARKESMTMTRFTSSVALAAVALTLSACGPETDRLTPVSNPSLSSVNQPVVQRTDFVLDVASSGEGVPTSEKGRLADWFGSLNLGYGDRVYVDESGYRDDRARADVAQVAADYGLLLSDGAPVSAGSAAPGSVRVIVSRTTASVPGCPVWEDQSVGAPETTATNYGCATNSNLAAMVADPNDLVRGQSGDATGDDVQASKAVKLYRDRKPSGGGGLKAETTGGN
jgi:pilus assembly protein CpaD